MVARRRQVSHNPPMYSYLLVAVGSAIGGTLRYWLSGLVAESVGVLFPWGTLIINVSGSFAIALFAATTIGDGPFPVPVEWRNFFMVGICGGYTTFSSFSLQTLGLMQSGQLVSAMLNVVGSVMLCLLGAWLGHMGALVLK